MTKIRCFLLFLFLADRVSANADASKPFIRSRDKVTVPPTPNHPTNAANNVLRIVEKEVYDGSEWRGAYPSRWTNPQTGKGSDPPPSLKPPKGYDFEGSWKIVTSMARDSLGWEYQWAKDEPAQRNRIWLRSIVPTPAQRRRQEQQRSRRKGGDPETSLSIQQQQQRQRRRSQSIQRLLQDDFNFKGFGLTLYKSFLFLRSCGVALSLPLLRNFDWWDRHPELPSLTSSVALYFPWMVMGWCSTSINTDWLQWMTWRFLRYLHVGVCALLLYALQGLCLPFLLLMYPVRKSMKR